MRAGAQGYLLKGADQVEIDRAIRAVVAGEAIFSPGVAQRVLGYFAAPPPRRATRSPSSPPASARCSTCVAAGRTQPADRRAALPLPQDRRQPHLLDLREARGRRPVRGHRAGPAGRAGRVVTAVARRRGRPRRGDHGVRMVRLAEPAAPGPARLRWWLGGAAAAGSGAAWPARRRAARRERLFLRRRRACCCPLAVLAYPRLAWRDPLSFVLLVVARRRRAAGRRLGGGARADRLRHRRARCWSMPGGPSSGATTRTGARSTWSTLAWIGPGLVAAFLGFLERSPPDTDGVTRPGRASSSAASPSVRWRWPSAWSAPMWSTSAGWSPAPSSRRPSSSPTCRRAVGLASAIEADQRRAPGHHPAGRALRPARVRRTPAAGAAARRRRPAAVRRPPRPAGGSDLARGPDRRRPCTRARRGPRGAGAALRLPPRRRRGARVVRAPRSPTPGCCRSGSATTRSARSWSGCAPGTSASPRPTRTSCASWRRCWPRPCGPRR